MELVLTPRLAFGSVVSQIANSLELVVSLFDVALVPFVDVVVERILKRKSVEIVGAFDFNGNGTDDGFIWAPGVGDESGGVEESRSDDISFEILLDSALFHVPSNNFDIGVRFVSDLDLVETVVSPVVALLNVPGVEVVVDVVVVTKIVGWVEVCGSH